MSDNIYTPPKATITATPEPSFSQSEVEKGIASSGRRFLNNFIDGIFIYLFSFLYGILLGAASFIFEQGNSTFDMLSQWGGIILLILYYLFFEYFTGRTIGKFITKTKVVTASGEKPSFRQILGRTASRFIPLEAFSFLADGGFPVGWHDRLSKTRVIHLSTVQKGDEKQ